MSIVQNKAPEGALKARRWNILRGPAQGAGIGAEKSTKPRYRFRQAPIIGEASIPCLSPGRNGNPSLAIYLRHHGTETYCQCRGKIATVTAGKRPRRLREAHVMKHLLASRGGESRAFTATFLPGRPLVRPVTWIQKSCRSLKSLHKSCSIWCDLPGTPASSIPEPSLQVEPRLSPEPEPSSGAVLRSSVHLRLIHYVSAS